MDLLQSNYISVPKDGDCSSARALRDREKQSTLRKTKTYTQEELRPILPSGLFLRLCCILYFEVIRIPRIAPFDKKAGSN